MSDFSVQPLARTQIATIFPLIREALPDMTLDKWTRLARRLTDPRHAGHSGVMVAQGANRRHISGVFYYRRERDLQYGWVLVANHFVALDMLDSSAVASVMLTEMERLALRLRCQAIRSVLHPASADLADGFYSAGHRLEGAALCKPLFPLPATEATGERSPDT